MITTMYGQSIIYQQKSFYFLKKQKKDVLLSLVLVA